MSDNTIRKIPKDSFAYYLINEQENVVVPQNQIMTTPSLEIVDGSIEVTGALEIK